MVTEVMALPVGLVEAQEWLRDHQPEPCRAVGVELCGGITVTYGPDFAESGEIRFVHLTASNGYAHFVDVTRIGVMGLNSERGIMKFLGGIAERAHFGLLTHLLKEAQKAD